MAPPGRIYQIHVLHERFVAQIGEPLSHHRIVQRDERQPAATVPAGQPPHLSGAKPAMTVKYDQIGIGPLVNGGKWLHLL